MAAIYDLIFSRRLGGDPTISHRDPSGVEATTFNNPAFKEKRSMNPSELIIIRREMYLAIVCYTFLLMAFLFQKVSPFSVLKCQFNCEITYLFSYNFILVYSQSEKIITITC